MILRGRPALPLPRFPKSAVTFRKFRSLAQGSASLTRHSCFVAKAFICSVSSFTSSLLRNRRSATCPQFHSANSFRGCEGAGKRSGTDGWAPQPATLHSLAELRCE